MPFYFFFVFFKWFLCTIKMHNALLNKLISCALPCGCCFCRDFLSSLRLYLTYYGGLADQLCVSDLASNDALSCWNGTEIVKRFVLKM